MRRPARTRRLSIAAILSLLAFVVLMGEGVRSYRIYDCWKIKGWRAIAVGNGALVYWRFTGEALDSVYEPAAGYQSGNITLGSQVNGLKFGTYEKSMVTRVGNLDFSVVWIPLWFPLLLLQIMPALWIIARPADAPAFPVVTDPK